MRNTLSGEETRRVFVLGRLEKELATYRDNLQSLLADDGIAKECTVVNFSFTWRHWDGSVVTFSPNGWTSSDPENTAWLNAMSHLTSSVPVAPPLVRIWLAEECQLLEVRRTGKTDAGESAKREPKHDVRRVPPEKHSKCLANDGNHLRIAPRFGARPQWPSALEVMAGI